MQSTEIFTQCQKDGDLCYIWRKVGMLHTGTIAHNLHATKTVNFKQAVNLTRL